MARAAVKASAQFSDGTDENRLAARNMETIWAVENQGKGQLSIESALDVRYGLLQHVKNLDHTPVSDLCSLHDPRARRVLRALND